MLSIPANVTLHFEMECCCGDRFLSGCTGTPLKANKALGLYLIVGNSLNRNTVIFRNKYNNTEYCRILVPSKNEKDEHSRNRKVRH